MASDCGHASNARYSVHGCRCDACRAAHAAEARARERRNAQGRSLYVDAGPVREHVRALLSVGYTMREITRFGVPRSTLNALMNGSAKTGKPTVRISRRVAELIYSIRGRRLLPGTLVPCAAARILVSGWLDSGLSVAAVARESGVDRSVIESLARGGAKYMHAENLVALLDHRDDLDYLAGDARDPSPTRRHGTSYSAALSDWEVEEAYSMHLGGMTTYAVAKRYGVDTKVMVRAFERLEDERARKGTT